MVSPRLTALLLAAVASAGAAELVPPVTLKAAAAWADNISRTSDPSTEKDAADYSVELSTGWHRQIARNWQTSLAAKLGYETVPDFDRMDVTRAGLAVALQRKFGLGPLAPVLEFNAAATHAGFREGYRSGWELSGGARLAKRFTATWRAALEGSWLEYYAKLHPFDIRQHRLQFETEWDVTERWQLGFGKGRIRGEITANAAWPVYGKALGGGFGPAVQAYYSSIPWNVTDTYGSGWVAYRVDSRVDFWWLSVSPALSDRTSAPLRYEEYEVVNRVGVHYKTRILSLSLIHRF